MHRIDVKDTGYLMCDLCLSVCLSLCLILPRYFSPRHEAPFEDLKHDISLIWTPLTYVTPVRSERVSQFALRNVICTWPRKPQVSFQGGREEKNSGYANNVRISAHVIVKREVVLCVVIVKSERQLTAVVVTR